MIRFDNYSRVILMTDRYRDEGVSTGSTGYIIETYDNGNYYKIEFSNPDGITIAQIVVQPHEIQPANE
jgi:hypothetical protein